MGRELQKKKNRSSISKVKQKVKSKRVNPLGNPIIAANWNQNETLTQNYRRLGLTSRLNTATGGIEKQALHSNHDAKTSTASRLAISNAVPKFIEPREARVVRDEEGRIVSVVHEGERGDNPLNDPLNEVEEGDEWEGIDGEEQVNKGGDDVKTASARNEIIQQLEAQARMGAGKRERKQSEREREWIERLVGRYGEDYGAMVRDRRLNPFQQTKGDIERRIGKWRAGGGIVETGVEA